MKIIIQNLAVEYRDEGAGGILLFLHGWQDNLHTFDALARSLARGRRIVRLDLPGFGRSQRPRDAWSTDDYALFLRDFCEKLGIRPDILAGHSFGGKIVIRAVGEGLLYPDKIVLIASSGVTRRRTLRNALAKVASKIAGAVVSLVPPLAERRGRMRASASALLGSDWAGAGAMRETFAKVVAEDMSAVAAKIRIPTLLVWGADDTSTPAEDARKLARLIESSCLEIIPGAGHFVHQEKPQEVARMIQEFLSPHLPRIPHGSAAGMNGREI